MYHVKEHETLGQKQVSKMILHFVWGHFSRKQTVETRIAIQLLSHFDTETRVSSIHVLRFGSAIRIQLHTNCKLRCMSFYKCSLPHLAPNYVVYYVIVRIILT